MSNLVLKASTDFLGELLKENGWKIRQSRLKLPSSTKTGIPGYETEGIYVPHGATVVLCLAETSKNKLAVVYFLLAPVANDWIDNHKYYNAGSFLASYGKTYNYEAVPNRCWIIDKPVDILSLIESYDRVASALHYETIIKAKDK